VVRRRGLTPIICEPSGSSVRDSRRRTGGMFDSAQTSLGGARSFDAAIWCGGGLRTGAAAGPCGWIVQKEKVLLETLAVVLLVLWLLGLVTSTTLGGFIHVLLVLAVVVVLLRIIGGRRAL
jgi:hypothetical protein